MGELLGAIGLAWPRLLLYPGGLFAVVAAHLLGAWLRRCAGSPVPAMALPGPATLCHAVGTLALLALLPLAPARSVPFGLDLFMALGLLEWPYLARRASRERVLRAYLPLIVATTALATATGSVELTALLRVPASPQGQALLAGGTALWLLALRRLLTDASGGVADDLRALGLLLVAALPVLGALASLLEAILPGPLAGWLLPPAAMLICALALGGMMRAARGRAC
ncbi:MAG: hypothetical protein OHK0015_55070 [Chloroflexi bacterium OHK40]